MNSVKTLLFLVVLLTTGVAKESAYDRVRKFALREFVTVNPSASCGQLPANYKALIWQRLYKSLKDPYSAKVDFSSPKRGWIAWEKDAMYGWMIHVEINAKNSYGGYTGSKPHFFFVQDQSASDVTDSFTQVQEFGSALKSGLFPIDDAEKERLRQVEACRRRLYQGLFVPLPKKPMIQFSKGSP